MNQVAMRELADKICIDHFNRPLVKSFIKRYENGDRAVGDSDVELIYWVLKFYYGPSRHHWLYLKNAGQILEELSLFAYAFTAYAQSLIKNPSQSKLRERLHDLECHLDNTWQGGLKENTCAVSIIMATYDRNEKIRAALESALNQDFDSYEIVVVNNAPNEDVKTVVESYHSDKIRYVHAEINQGQPSSINEGIRQANGKYIAHLDDDDLYYPNHLNNLYELAESTHSGFVYSNTHGLKGYDTPQGYHVDRDCFIWDAEYTPNKLLNKIFMAPVAVMHRKDVVLKSGGYCRNFISAADWDFFIRTTSHTKVSHLNKITTEYRLRDNNTTIRRRLLCYFYGDLVKFLNSGYRGKLAYAVHSFADNRADSLKLYNEARVLYDSRGKSVHNLQEMFRLACAYNDHELMSTVIDDYSNLYFKSALKFFLIGRARLASYRFLGDIYQAVEKKIKKICIQIRMSNEIDVYRTS